MQTYLTHNGIAIDLMMNESPVYIAGRGYVHFAELMTEVKTEDLKKLIGLNLWGEEVRGVEYFATSHQPVSRKIGLLMNKQVWKGNE